MNARRRARTAGLATLLVVGASAAAGADSAPRVLRPRTLLEDAERYLGKVVEIEIVEPLSGPPTPELLAKAEYGQARVQMPEGSAAELALVPKSFRPDDPKRYRQRFERVLEAPLRVRGELLEDGELRHGERRSYVLRVDRAEALPASSPIFVHSLAELEADRARFDRATVELTGSHVSGFEKSALEGKIWLSQSPGATVTGEARRDGKPQQVRVVGTLFAAPSAHYGHLGGYSFQLVAREIEYRP